MRAFLLEANVFNAPELQRSLLPPIAEQLPEPYKKQFIKAAFTDLVNDEQHHEKITKLPPDAPSWAQTAFDNGDLVKASISPAYRNLLERIVHWLTDLIAKTKSTPAPGDTEGTEDKNSATRQLASLNRMTIENMLQAESQWWARHAQKTRGDTSGMIKVADVANGYTWWRLDSKDAYTREGKVLNNCIGSIYTKAYTEAQRQYILILKDPTLESHVAMRITNKGEMQEVKGMNNRPPAAVYMGYTNEVLKQLGITVGYAAEADLAGAGYAWTPETGIAHLSTLYPFEQGPALSGRRMLVKWTSPPNIWYASFAGPNGTVAGSPPRDGNRWDVVSQRNTHHPLLSVGVSRYRLDAVGNLFNPKFIIKETTMKTLRDTLEEICQQLRVTPSPELNGRADYGGAPGLRRYGITVENGTFLADHELAVTVSLAENPLTIGSIPNPSEKLQLECIRAARRARTDASNVIQLIDTPTPAAMQEAVMLSQTPHKVIDILLDKLGEDGIPEKTVLSAVERDGLALENLRKPSEAVELAAVKQNPWAFAYICYWHSETNRGIPSSQVVDVAVSKTPQALEYMLDNDFQPSPRAQMTCAKAFAKSKSELKLIMDIMGDALDPSVAQFIQNTLK